MRISAHRLYISNPAQSLDFYQRILGMVLVKQTSHGSNTIYRLAFAGTTQAELELVYHPAAPFTVAPQPNRTHGYWKFAISVDDLAQARAQLKAKGVNIGESFNVAGLAYLCHLTDPDGYCIELIQKTLFESAPLAASLAGAKPPSPLFNLSTLRVKSAANSIAFYQSIGMRLIYTYRSQARGMALFFLISEDDYHALVEHPAPQIEEKLWQFPTTVLELQQLDETDNIPDFRYHISDDTGFLGLDMQCSPQQFEQLAHHLAPNHTQVALSDPDGYQLRISQYNQA